MWGPSLLSGGLLVRLVVFSMLFAVEGGHAGHLKILTFYDMDPQAQHGWMNVYRGGLNDWKNSTITDVWKMKILLGLEGEIFTRSSPPPGAKENSLYPNWASEVDKFVAAAAPQIQSGKVLGVFMGDEICCSGTPYANLSSVASRLREGLGPDAWIYTNECSEMSQWPPLRDGQGGVPPALDAISVDFYDEENKDGAAEVAKNKKFYHEVIFPRLRGHQQALFVPGVFASSPEGCMSKGRKCPLDSQAEQIVIKLSGFFEWAKTEPRIAGFNPWHFRNRTRPQFALPYDQKLGAVSMPTVVAKLREIGEYITGRTEILV